jgi:hypothetical protein
MAAPILSHYVFGDFNPGPVISSVIPLPLRLVTLTLRPPIRLMVRFSLRSLLIAVTYVAFCCYSLLYPTRYSQTALSMTVTLLVASLGTIAALSKGAARTFCVAFVAFTVSALVVHREFLVPDTIQQSLWMAIHDNREAIEEGYKHDQVYSRFHSIMDYVVALTLGLLAGFGAIHIFPTERKTDPLCLGNN